MEKITVADIDRICSRYDVIDEDGFEIGSKSPGFGYLKPAYPRSGGKCKDIEKRKYKSNPPWMKYTAIRIDAFGGTLTIRTKKDQ